MNNLGLCKRMLTKISETYESIICAQIENDSTLMEITDTNRELRAHRYEYV